MPLRRDGNRVDEIESVEIREHDRHEKARERPWLLIAPDVACIVAAIVGALGPWFEYERISETNSGTWTTPGFQSSGFFIAVFAAAALVTLAAALLRDRGEPLAWVAFICMALCTVIIISVWTDPPRQTIPSGGTGTIGRLAWGPLVVIIAAPLGALVTFLVARRLPRANSDRPTHRAEIGATHASDRPRIIRYTFHNPMRLRGKDGERCHFDATGTRSTRSRILTTGCRARSRRRSPAASSTTCR